MSKTRTCGENRYPIPAEYPHYDASFEKIAGAKQFSVADIFEFAAVIIGVILTIWLGGLLAWKGTSLEFSSLIWLILFWAVMAYLALPRLHQFFTALYVPDYFIARTRTMDGVLGDPVNLALEGSAEDIHTAMQKAGWVLADEITLGSSWGIVKSSILGTSYPEAPVSDLYLFGNRHAFAYQQEVDGNAAQRHHIRFWPTPEGWLLPGGHQVGWLAAGTYDRSVGLSIFTGQVTHKIDANIDKERDYVIDTVRYADPLSSVELIEDFSTAYHHRNGGGDLVHTDGDLPVLNVTGAAQRHPELLLEKTTEGTSSSQTVENTEKTIGTSLAKQVEKTKKHHLPPLPFLLSGIIIFFSAIVATGVWALILPALGDPEFLREVEKDALENQFYSLGTFAFLTILLVLAVILWILTAKRHRWARILLLALSAIGTFQDLVTASISGDFAGSNLLAAGVSVLVLWAISSDSMRQWVNEGK